MHGELRPTPRVRVLEEIPNARLATLSPPAPLRMLTTPAWPFGSARSFCSPGAGGSLGFADPQRESAAYVTSQMGHRIDR